jgi:hypothetical protein
MATPLPPQAAPAEGRLNGADAPMHQSREAHPLGLAAPSPGGGPGRTLGFEGVVIALRREPVFDFKMGSPGAG